MKAKVTNQAALNVDRFSTLPIDCGYTLYAGSVQTGYHMIDRYHKIGETRCQASDGRQWELAETRGSGANAILVPDGARSIVDYDARAANA